jgi:hypothetical protein
MTTDTNNNSILAATTTTTTTTTNNSNNHNTRWTATVTKETEDSLVGISFSGDGTAASPVIVASIRPDGPVARHGNLHVGLRVRSINGLAVWEGYSAAELAGMVRTSAAGEALTIVARGVVASWKGLGRRRERVGMSLYRNIFSNAIVVGHILPDSMVVDSGIRVGQRLTMINGVPCPSETRDAIERILNSEETLTLVAVDMVSNSTTSSLTGSVNSLGDLSYFDDGQHAAIATTTSSPSPSSLPFRWMIRAQKAGHRTKDVGMSLQKDHETSSIYVQSIAPTSIFKDTALRRGHVLVKINGFACPPSTRDAVKIIQNIETAVWLEVLELPELMERIGVGVLRVVIDDNNDNADDDNNEISKDSPIISIADEAQAEDAAAENKSSDTEAILETNTNNNNDNDNDDRTLLSVDYSASTGQWEGRMSIPASSSSSNKQPANAAHL